MTQGIMQKQPVSHGKEMEYSSIAYLSDPNLI